MFLFIVTFLKILFYRQKQQQQKLCPHLWAFRFALVRPTVSKFCDKGVKVGASVLFLNIHDTLYLQNMFKYLMENIHYNEYFSEK